ncbi:hypothetical protein K435DRAFT_703533 [Dendrothele bispora CBS 962.96]|uniref:hAT-like transposase RNase-H fold domain-containing protein n=1 Tax=Dendrothele bispora (strain CBS 962.96) TaxID=1314807 RepID=A0A4S8KMZ2_DENBC|nr:hypothetical protein K435DRAFT_703533 [Dendrothele bispora CBS 962.96]
MTQVLSFKIRASSLRRQFFSECLHTLEMKDLQLLRDVDTRWSSVLLMIDRAILLKDAINHAINAHPELADFYMIEREWDALKMYSQILMIPHAFQERLSAEKTPTLSFAIPAYEAMITKWTNLKAELPQAAPVIDAGIAKLVKYRDRVDVSDAYTLAMVLNPSIKLVWFKRFKPRHIEQVKDLLIREVRVPRHH